MFSLQPAKLKSGQKVMLHVKRNRQTNKQKNGVHEKLGKEQFLIRKMNYKNAVNL